MSSDSETESIDQLYASPPEGETIVEPTALLQKRVKAVGSRQAVWDGDARKTSGNLTKADLFLCPKTGSVKSIKASQQSKDVMASRKASNNSKPESVCARVKKIEQVLQEDEASPIPVVKHRRTKSVKIVENEPAAAAKKPAGKKRASKKN